ncbi:MAG: aldehyde dehydrogenase (NADP(+)) [Chitinophagales bacterium]|nr:aldehyde dehydrogenase (NADP(+)) [Chitinophagales bacterium]
MYQDATINEIDNAMQKAWNAFMLYRTFSLRERADLMRAIANELELADDSLIETAMQETNLSKERLVSEKQRTIFQLNSYANACENGSCLDARIDTANETLSKIDLRKMLIPIGPVAVFGSSNFPFAYSTAGGDTACAFAAGCSVVVKAHPAHVQTSTLVAKLIDNAIKKCKMPKEIFTHIYGASFEIGKALVTHPFTKAVGFTGSFEGGKQLFDWANQRRDPIPVFAEMGSTNPVFLFPEKLSSSVDEIAEMYAKSITLGVGQFCTNPGIIIGIEGESLKNFIQSLSEKIKKFAPAKMLHQGIATAFYKKINNIIEQKNIVVITNSNKGKLKNLEASPILIKTSAEIFLQNTSLHNEVFGPFSIIVSCNNLEQMKLVAQNLQGQLTSTIIASENELIKHKEIIEIIKNICGRIIFNGVPTGVEVCLSMQHGGPFPATTDSRFTAVGADGIKRFVRPIAYQNCPNSLLPDELKNENPLNIYRTINNKLTKEKIAVLK